MSASPQAVFLSYASQDAEAAKRICEALREAGIEVWFDQSELRGGDAWDQKIRKQIKDCALFVPIISANTQARHEGYFRLEWRLADRRTELMGKAKAFVVPVCVDNTGDADADVPDSFLAVQWMRVPGGDEPGAFCERVKVLLESEPAGAALGRDSSARSRPKAAPATIAAPAPAPRWMKPVLASAGLVVVALAVTLWQRSRETGPSAAPPPVPTASEKLSPARELAERARKIIQLPSLTRPQLDAAEELCDRARQLDASDPVVWAIAADVELYYIYPYGYDMSEERRRRAQDYAARAASLGPDVFDVRVVRAMVLAHAIGTPALMTEAEQTFRQLIAGHPGDRRLVFDLAEVMRDGKRYDAAAKLFESIGDFEVAAWSYFQADELRAALAAVSRAPRSVTAILLKATLQARTDEDPDEAWATINRLQPSELLAEMPAVVAIHLAYWRRDPDGMLELAKGLNSDYLDSHAFIGPLGYYTGLAHELAGRTARAEADWRAALGLVESRLTSAPDNRELLLWSAWLHAMLHDTAAAEKIFARSQALASLNGDTMDSENGLVLLALHKREAILAGAARLFRAKKSGWEEIHADLRFSPAADFLRGDPRFEKLLRDHLPEGAKPLPAAQ